MGDTDFDWGRIIFLILVVIMGFFRWFGNVLEQQKAARQRKEMTPEEKALREDAWQRQVGKNGPLSPPPPPAKPKSTDPFGELKRMMEELQKPTTAPTPASQPPPLRPRQVATPPPLHTARPSAAKPPPRLEQPERPQRATAARHPVPAAPAQPHLPHQLSVTAQRRQQRVRALRRDLGRPDSLQKAVLLQEILSTPKGLR